MKRLTLVFTVAVWAISIGLVDFPLSAQPIWLTQTEGNFVSIEVLKPNYEGGRGLSFITSATFITGRFSVGENVAFVGELPLVYSKSNFTNFDFTTGELIVTEGTETETMVGNPYVGLEFRRPGANNYFELGVRLPIAPDDKFVAPQIGEDADFDRFEAFLTDFIPISGRLNYQKKNASNVVLRLRGGATVFVPTNEGDTEMFFDYGGQVEFEIQKISIIGGITGRMFVTEDELDLGERTAHQFGASASLNLGTVSPGIHLRIPIDDEFDADYILGLNVVIQKK